ncbi:MAG: hypothetical protein IPJ69_06575 [Deltaproteobacteria bacterium]|nr:MAG: hypothetical protein IPJ69_06575 [Deltaproteobacteria bacterium]
MAITVQNFARLYPNMTAVCTLGPGIIGSLLAGREPAPLESRWQSTFKACYDESKSPESRAQELYSQFRGASQFFQNEVISTTVLAKAEHAKMLGVKVDAFKDDVSSESLPELEGFTAFLQMCGVIPQNLDNADFYQEQLTIALCHNDSLKRAEASTFLIYMGASICLADNITDPDLLTDPVRTSLTHMAFDHWTQVVWEDLNRAQKIQITDNLKDLFSSAVLRAHRSQRTDEPTRTSLPGQYAFDDNDDTRFGNAAPISSRTDDGALVSTPFNALEVAMRSFMGYQIAPSGSGFRHINAMFEGLIKLKDHNYELQPISDLVIPEVEPVSPRSSEENGLMELIGGLKHWLKRPDKYTLDNQKGVDVLKEIIDRIITALNEIAEKNNITLHPTRVEYLEKRRAYVDGCQDHFNALEEAFETNMSEEQRRELGDKKVVTLAMQNFLADMVAGCRFIPHPFMRDKEAAWNNFLERLQNPVKVTELGEMPSTTEGAPEGAADPEIEVVVELGEGEVALEGVPEVELAGVNLESTRNMRKLTT